MKRKDLVGFTHNAKNFLEVSNSTYKQWVFRYTFLELEKDLGLKGDITTNSLFKARKTVEAQVVSRESGVVAGLEEIKYFLCDADVSFRSRLNDRFALNFHIKDGDFVEEGSLILEIEADVHDLLAVERVVLNLLGRMSGVASFSREIIEMVKEFDVLVTPTRKTLWGLLDKKAVSVGGGGTHRLNLADAILVKDNHLDLVDRNFDILLERLSILPADCRFVEIEVDSEKEAFECMEAFLDHKFDCIPVIMLDNMRAEEVKSVIEEVKKEKFYDDFLFEASGGIDKTNIYNYATAGVDIISMGCLTQGVKSLDLSLEII